MNPIWLLHQYFKWLYKAHKLHGIHAPFLYGFTKECLYKNSNHPDIKSIEYQRKKLLTDPRSIEYKNYGSGSRVLSQNKIRIDSLAHPPLIETLRIKDIAKHSLQKKKYCKLLYRMVQYFEPENILELGTSLGISTSYLSKANPNSHIDTIEGSEKISELASDVFSSLNLKNITQHTAKFSDTLPYLLSNKLYDFIYLDGDHNQTSVVEYFNEIIKQNHEKCVLVVDDIRWSKSMLKAWQCIKDHPKVSISIDLFTMGVVFFNPKFSKENFLLRF